MGTDSPQTQATVPNAMQGQVGQISQDISKLQVPNLSMTPGQSQAVGFAQGQGQNTINSANNFLQSLLSPGFTSPQSNPYLGQTVSGMQDLYSQNLGRSLSDLSSAFGTAGQGVGSGAYQGQATQLANQSLGQFNTSLAQMLMGNYQTGVNQQLQGLSQAGQPLSMENQAAQISAIPQQLQQQNYQNQQTPIQMLTQLLQATPVSYPSYGQSQFSQIAPFLGSLLGTGASAYGTYQGGQNTALLASAMA